MIRMAGFVHNEDKMEGKIMDGLFFLYINWMLWVVLFFLMPNSQMRMWISNCLLLLIITSSFEVQVSPISVTLANLLIIVVSLFIIAIHSRQHIRTACLALSVCIGYVGALMWEMVSPVWIFAPRLLIYSVLAFMLMLLISDSMWLRIAIWGLGSSVGEIVYSFLLIDFGFHEPVGDLAYLDIYSLVIFLIVITSIGGKFLNWLENTVTDLVKRKAGV